MQLLRHRFIEQRGAIAGHAGDWILSSPNVDCEVRSLIEIHELSAHPVGAVRLPAVVVARLSNRIAERAIRAINPGEHEPEAQAQSRHRSLLAWPPQQSSYRR